MSFDPEKVERARMWEGEIDRGEIIMAADYDKLLMLYREAQKKLILAGPNGFQKTLLEAQHPQQPANS